MPLNKDVRFNDVLVTDGDGSFAIPDLAVKTTSANGEVTYTPWLGGRGEVGYRCEHQDGRVEFIYFNPSDNPDGGDVSNVFVYQGEAGDPNYDGAMVHYLTLES